MPIPITYVNCSHCGSSFRPERRSRQSQDKVFCDKNCQKQYFNHDDRIWENINKTDGCWYWTGVVHPTGYGMFRKRQAHRVVYEKLVSPIDVGKILCHSCDTRSCVNPKHLVEGSHQDNMDDMVSKKRQSRGGRAGNTKLTPEIVVKLRFLYALGGVTYPSLARQFGYTIQLVTRAVTRRTWKSIP